jgi:hypothetical protein
VRIDIKRRDPLTETIESPLKAAIGGIMPARKADQAPAPEALDLTDVQAADVAAPTKNGSPARPKWPNLPARTDPEPASPEAGDLNDWI